MRTEIENLMYFVKELFNTDIIKITEKGFRYQFDVNAVPMECFIEVEQDSFTIIAENKSLKVLFLANNLKSKFKQLTDYIIILKQFIENTRVYSNKKLRE